jgi:hypothetical protein
MSWYSQRTRSGVDGSPSHASADKGARLFQGCAQLLADMACSFAAMRLPERADHRPQPAWREGVRSTPGNPGSG